ncbi:bolA-like protein 3 [Aplysia californica]|uniref:BolA-like protein 3 n=1 Tax=Aplysia californica TaxID=6500 RepID=A0ABM0K0L7_APLCA|nr:bolA-like protein 3 [Aplysia californica]
MASLTYRIASRMWRTLQAPIASRFRARHMSNGEGPGISDLTVGEQKIISKLQESFPNATHIQVADVSGGCGAMYQILIETPEFEGKRTVQQHRMVNEALKEEIKAMHGLQLTTKVPSDSDSS